MVENQQKNRNYRGDVKPRVTQSQKSRLKTSNFARKDDGMDVLIKIWDLRQHFKQNFLGKDEQMPTRIGSTPPNLDEQKRNEDQLASKRVRNNMEPLVQGRRNFHSSSLLVPIAKQRPIFGEDVGIFDDRGMIMSACGGVLKELPQWRNFIPIDHPPTVEDIDPKLFPTLLLYRGKEHGMELESTYLDQFRASDMGCLDEVPADEPLDIEIELLLDFLKHHMSSTPVTSLTKNHLVEESKFNLLLAGTTDIIFLIEDYSGVLTGELLLQVIDIQRSVVKAIYREVEICVNNSGKNKMNEVIRLPLPNLMNRLKNLLKVDFSRLYNSKVKCHK
eukprot:Gb_00313 [translate_table: standard]